MKMTRQNINALEQALGLFHSDDRGIYTTNRFVDLAIGMKINGNPSSRIFKCVQQDIWNIGTLYYRLEWLRTMAADKKMDRYVWGAFTELDIENFFTQVRSLMDHVMEVLNVLLPHGKTLPESFGKTRDSMDKYHKKIPSKIASLIDDAVWFDEVRCIRDKLIHRGATTMVFGEPQEGILFQVYDKGGKNHNFAPWFMYNENVAYFDRYACLVAAQLLVFLDSLGAELRPCVEFSMNVGTVRSQCAGFPLLRQDMARLLSALRDCDASESSVG